MALEKGGRSDKEGNTYENFFLGKQLLRLVEGQHKSVEVEPLGDEGQGVEYIVTRTDNTRIYYQCKASNAAKTDWTISDLAKHKVFENAQKHILRSPNNEFHFISPLPCSSLNDLCERARKNHSVSDFMAYQVTNEALRKAFSGCEEQFNLYRDNPDELEQLVFILSKCYFEQAIKTYESVQDVEDRVRWIFTGDSTMVRMALENYANDQSRYGVELSAHEIIDFLRQRGFALRDYGHEAHVWKRIQTLNEAHWEAYTPIKGTLIYREAAKTAIDSLMSNTSIILHGKAGSGKSGCVEIVSNYLRENHILFLRLKLDKSIPENSSDQYGHDLGLPDSPVRCLQKMAGRQKCVLILDQLDSLRWTTTHSPTALSVCKELISEIEVANRYYGANISVMFVTRSFDYRCDARIKSLFAENTNESKKWKEIEVGFLSDGDVSEIVGSRYSSLSVKLKELLRTPSSLYVWMQLDEDRHKQVITSAHQLLHEWWKQTLERCEQKSINTYEMDQFAHADYSRWSAEDYNESALRKIVQITKMAVCEYAEKYPDAFISEIVCKEHAKALTGNEIILVAMMRLPVTSADFVINWLCDSFPQHLFDHTGSKKDSLAVAKSLLEKFTAHCTQATFEKVESYIVHWSEPSATMIDTFEYRVKCQKTYPVYYAYWGFMQKELLPAMDQKRLSNAAKELLAVLNRNEWIQVPHYRNSFSVGEAKWVTSPIEKYVHRISDKTWLNIVRTPVEKMSSHRWTETKSP